MLPKTISVFNKDMFVTSMFQFQQEWEKWMCQTYSTELINDPKEASDRFAEEAIEMMQAVGMTKEQVLFMVDHVFSRASGEPGQEAAGVLSCLATLCNQRNINLGEMALTDLNYCWNNLTKIQAKNAKKPRYKS